MFYDFMSSVLAFVFLLRCAHVEAVRIFGDMRSLTNPTKDFGDMRSLTNPNKEHVLISKNREHPSKTYKQRKQQHYNIRTPWHELRECLTRNTVGNATQPWHAIEGIRSGGACIHFIDNIAAATIVRPTFV